MQLFFSVLLFVYVGKIPTRLLECAPCPLGVTQGFAHNATMSVKHLDITY